MSCAVSGTGEGEYLIREVVGHTISMLIEAGMGVQEACQHVVHARNYLKGEMGVISLNQRGDFGISFNTEIMKRAWKSSSQELQVKIYN